MASRLTGSVYTSDVTTLEHLRVRLTVPGSPPIDVSLDEAGEFSVPIGHAKSRDDEPAVTDPDRYDDELDELGVSEFLEATQADTSEARAIVAQILYEDPSLLIADPAQLPASLEVVDTRTGTPLARHDFFPAPGLLDAPTSLELAVPPIAALDVGPALAETTTADAKLERLTAACAVPYSPALPRTKAFSFWRSAAQLIKGDSWRVVFEAKDEFERLGDVSKPEPE